MTSLLVWTVGNIQPSITQQVTSGDSPVNLSSASATFNMRPVGSTALKVSAAAVVLSPAIDGVLQYNWQAADVDTAGTYLVWWDVDVTGSTAIQSVGESLVEFRGHAANGYCELEEMKRALTLTGQSFADLDIETAITAASRAIDNTCGRFFYQETSVSYYDAPSFDMVLVDDVVTVSEFAIDLSGTGSSFVASPTNTWVAGPYNNPSIDRPYEWIRLRNWTGPYFPTWYQQTLRVTGVHGWPQVPAPIKEATMMLAHRYLRRVREAPFSIMTVGMESMRAIKIEQSDPDVFQLIQGYIRSRPIL